MRIPIDARPGDRLTQSKECFVRIAASVVWAVALSTVVPGHAWQRGPQTAQEIRVILLGTQGGPSFSAERIGIGTLVVAGQERLLFDAGRSITTSPATTSIPRRRCPWFAGSMTVLSSSARIS
jgi:hypothetical protein